MSEGVHTAYRVAEVIPEGRAGVTLVFDGTLSARPGQFVMAWLPGVEERPFSVMEGQPLSLTIADVGPFTHAFCARQPSDRVWIRGPYGHGFELRGRRHLLVAGGCGAAALTMLAREARDRGDEVTVALGAKSEDQLMLDWRFEELGCRMLIATEDGSAGYHGTALEAIEEQLTGNALDGIYGCGPEGMLMGLAQYAEKRRIPCWVSMERVMKCGIGVCGTCHCGDRLVCRDGPVFSAAMLLQLAEPNAHR